MNSQTYCQNLARKSGSSFYYSFLLLPKVRRRAIIALYAFCREVDDIVDNQNNITDASQKLAIWHDYIDNLTNNQNNNPILNELYYAHQKFNIELVDLQKIISGMQMDVNFLQFQTWDDLFKYCDLVAGVVGRISAKIFGYQLHNHEKIACYATNLGQALQLINILRDIQADAKIGRIYLPRELTNIINCLANKTLEQQIPTLLNDLEKNDYLVILNNFAKRIENTFSIADKNLPPEEYKSQMPGIVMGKIYRKLFIRIKNYQIQGGARLSTFEKIKIIFSQLVFKNGLLNNFYK